MSLESYDKELTTSLEIRSITNEITPINNENNVTILTQNVCCHRFHKTYEKAP